MRNSSLALKTTFRSEILPHPRLTERVTRAIAAAGRVLIRHNGFRDGHPVLNTLAAAEDYSRRPSEQAYKAYFDAATRSFPYGAGEGCYKVRGSTSCERATGVGAAPVPLTRSRRRWAPRR